MNFSVVIPTYNRPDDLARCLDSIRIQNLKPSEVIIVDDGDLNTNFVNHQKQILNLENISWQYYHKDHGREIKGTSPSRNQGLKLSHNEIVFILDDDLILESNFFEKIITIWEDNTDPNLIGVGGIITNNRPINFLEKIFNFCFGLTTNNHWDINRVGFQSWNDNLNTNTKGFYVHGGVCAYKKNLTEKIGFAILATGRMALEDVDFCWRAKKQGYYFITAPQARVLHRHSPQARESQYTTGHKESQNRKIIFQNNAPKHWTYKLWFNWCNLGWILKQLLVGHFKKSAGLLVGWWKKI